MQPKGKTLLMVSGILLILWNLISVISGIIGIVGSLAGGLALGMMGSAAAGATFGGLLVVAFIFAMILQLFYFICGIIGVANAAKPQKAGKCYTLGIVMLVLAAIGLVLAFMNGNATASSMVGSLVSLVLPILYVMGASKNKQNA